MLTKNFEKKSETTYAIFRIFTALLFLQHGLQKMFGAFGGVNGTGLTPPLFSQFWWAGLIELAAGFGIALGLFTRPLAIIAALEMVFAYFLVHAAKGAFPILNQGELAALYFFAFLFIAARGAGKWSLEKAISGKELF